MQTHKPEAFFFDWDGTLVDTLPGLFRAHNAVREALGHPVWSMEEYTKHMHHSSRELYPRLYGDRSDEAIEMLFDFVTAHHLEDLSALPGAIALVESLRDAGVPFGIVSNKRDAVLHVEIAHMGWRDLSVISIGAGIAARDKPSGDPILYATEKAGIDIGKIWYIGDTIADLEAAAAAGCPCILITNGQDKSALIERYKPLHVVSDCHELAALLFSALSGPVSCSAM